MVRSDKKDKSSTMRIKESTKQKLAALDFAHKGLSFDEIISELIVKYQQGGRK